MIDLGSSSTIYRELNGSLDKIVAGSFCHLFTENGKALFDFSGGPCVSSLGHSNHDVKMAIINQLHSVPYVYSGFWGTNASENLGALLKEEFERTWPGWFGKVSFACSGNEAVDFACRLASQYWIESGTPKTVIAARKYGFHGTNLLTSAITDDYGRYIQMVPWYFNAREHYLMWLPGYIDDYGDDHAKLIAERALLLQIRNEIVRANNAGKPISALILEPVGGPPVGAAVPSRIYLQGLRRICDENDVLLIFDEVLCGSGRVGEFTAAQHFDVRPDIIVLGKGITSGYIPLSAIVLSERVVAKIRDNSGVTMIGTTYLNHPVAAAAAVATLTYMKDNNVIQSVREYGGDVLFYLRQSFADVDFVKKVRGLGYLWGIQLWNPETLSAFPPQIEMHKRVRKALYAAGIITYSKGQTVDGLNDYIMLSPPYEADVSMLIEQIDKIKYVLSSFNWKELVK